MFSCWVTQGGLCPPQGCLLHALCAKSLTPLSEAQNLQLLTQHRQGARNLLGERAGNSETVVEKSFILLAGPHVAWSGPGPKNS